MADESACTSNSTNSSAIILRDEDVPGAKLQRNVKDCSVEELKRWLECHGLKKSGKKDQLADRVKQAALMKVPIDVKVDNGKWYELKKINLRGNSSTVSYDMPNEGWDNFPSRNIPANFNYGHIYHYVVETLEFFDDTLAVDGSDTDSSDLEQNSSNSNSSNSTSKPLRKAQMLVKSGFVENVEDTLVNDIFMLRGHVHHSMKVEKPLKVFVAISYMSGFIKYGSCDCRANASGRCTHVTALLLFLNKFILENGTTVNTPCTSKPCKWNLGKKREKKPDALHKNQYTKKVSKNSSSLYNWDPRPPEKKSLDKQLLSNFVIDLQSISSTEKEGMSMWETLFDIEYQNFSLDDDDTSIYKDNVKSFEENLKFSDIANVCVEVPDTKDQFMSVNWHNSRWFRVTASICKDIVLFVEKLPSDINNQSLYKFLESRLWFSKNIQTFDMLYGIREEKHATEKYCDKYKVSVVPSGLWINSSYVFLGASPDGLIYNSSGEIEGIIEIKSLKILRNRTVEELILNRENSEIKVLLQRQCFKIVGDNLKLKISHKYYYQIQLQLLVTKAKYCDFILHSNIGIPHVERIFHDHELQQKIINSSFIFCRRILIPEYFIMRVPRKLLPIIF